jgi:hypothetical protein
MGGRNMMHMFQNDPQGYQNWWDSHPIGYIINAPKPGRSGKLKLHQKRITNDCFHIRPPWHGYDYTNSKVKMCFDDEKELIAWQQGQSKVLEACRTCNPELNG